MAKKATLKFEDRMFQGHRIAAALTKLEISQETFLGAYDSVEIERARKWDDVTALQLRLQELQANAGKPAEKPVKVRKADKAAA